MCVMVQDGHKETELVELEEKVRSQSKRRQIETTILGCLSLAGFMTVAVMAPNAIKVLHKAFPDLRPINQKQSIRRAIGGLIKKGYIVRKDGKYHLSKDGEDRLYLLTLHSSQRLNTKKGRKWDKKWRIVTFDIPEKEKHKRNMLRNFLIETGFVKLQDSVWVYPFRCDEVVALLKFNLKLGRRAVYIIADAIEGDEWLREHFKLPSD